MILLKKIQLSNFLSHQNTIIEFGEDEKALIDGVSGAGKSSIFDAIIWNLYGVSRADNRSLIRRGVNSGFVHLELKKDEETIVIIRSVSSSGKHTLEIFTKQADGRRVAYPLSGVRELQLHIEKNIIGASYLLFVNSVAYVQGNTESFVTQTAPKRKELLLEIIKAEDYTKYYENARQTLSKLENDHIKASTEIEYFEARIKALEASVGERNFHVAAIGRNIELLGEIEPLILKLEEEKAKFQAIGQNISNLQEALNNAIKDVDSALLDLAKKSNKVAEKKALLVRLSTAPELSKTLELIDEKRKKLKEEMFAASEVENTRNEFMRKKPVVHDDNFQSIDRKKRQIETIKKNPQCPSGEACPYSGDHVKEIEKLENDIKILQDLSEKEALDLANWSIEFGKLPEATRSLNTVIKEISACDLDAKNVESKISELSVVKKEISHIEEIEATIPELESSLEEKKLRIVKARTDKRIAEESVNNEEMSRVSTELTAKKKERDSFKETIIRAQSTLDSIAENEKELVDSEKKILVSKDALSTSKDKSKKVEMVKQAFGSKGIETLVIDYLLPKLEDKINEVLSKLSDFRVRLDTQKKKADGEGVTEGLFVTILNEVNEEMPFESYSGGEKLKISVAISEALATLQKVGFRLFDETFIGLDENSTESFTRILGSLQKNFSQVLCISHLLQIKELFDKKINIIKNNNISYVR